MITLYINTTKVRFSFDIGWYRGNTFVLFDLKMFEVYDYCTTLFYIQIAKFSFDISITKIEE